MKNGGIFDLCLTCNVEIKKLNEINIEGRKATWRRQNESKKDENKKDSKTEEGSREEKKTDNKAKNSCVFTEGSESDTDVEEVFEEVGEKKKRKKEAQKKRKEIKEKEAKQKKGICRHFIRNRCREGTKGGKCAFFHPQKCSKGVKEGPNACKDKKCELYHAKVCYGSLIKPRKCDKLHCTFVHLPNTERKSKERDDKTEENIRKKFTHQNKDFPKLPVRPEPPQMQIPVTPQGDPQVSHRLDEMEKMMTKMMGMMMMQTPLAPRSQEGWRPAGL